MQSTLVNLTYEVELKKGEKFSLPKEAVKQIKPGKWLITIMPSSKMFDLKPVRVHSAFLNGYADEDEELYDDYSIR